ncbi:MAG: ferric reductase-like transmembrane domain-containing protein [Pseudomonadota bacterium]
MARTILIWAALAVALVLPVAIAATSPQLAWRGPVYIAAGFAGVTAMSLLLLQPLLAGGYLPGLTPRRARRLHAWTGAGLVTLVILHVALLWVTSPPDVIDVLLFRSPTPFSVWGAVAMWATFAAGLLATLRRKLRLRPATWRVAHLALTSIVIIGSIVHAMQIEGTMETVSKIILCALVLAATVKILADVRPWSILARH